MMGYCPNCDEDQILRIEHRNEVYEIRSEPVGVDAEVTVCTKCGETVSNPDKDDRILKAAYEIYRQRHNLLMPNEIRDLRERYGLSQRALARLLGWGLVTIQRYEQGALQDKAHDTVLRRLEDPQFVLNCLDRCGHKLSEREKRVIREAAVTAETRWLSERLKEVLERRIGSRYSVSGVERGFRALDLERCWLAIWWFSKGTSDLFKTKLAKLLWLVDFSHFRHYRISITGLAYARGTWGPVPDRFGSLLGYLEDEGLIRLVESRVGCHQGDLIVPEDEPQVEELDLTPAEIESFERVIEKFGYFSAKELSDLSHKESAWLERTDGEVIPYTEADKLTILNEL